MKITDEMLRKYGYDENCLRCRNRKAGLASKMNHSEQCRKRIYEEMEKDEDGRKKKQQNEERENRRIAEELERNVNKEKSQDEDGMDGEFKYEQAVASNEMPVEGKLATRISKAYRMKVGKKGKLKVNMQKVLKRKTNEVTESYKMMTWSRTWTMRCPMID